MVNGIVHDAVTGQEQSFNAATESKSRLGRINQNHYVVITDVPQASMESGNQPHQRTEETQNTVTANAAGNPDTSSNDMSTEITLVSGNSREATSLTSKKRHQFDDSSTAAKTKSSSSESLATESTKRQKGGLFVSYQQSSSTSRASLAPTNQNPSDAPTTQSQPGRESQTP